MGKALLVVTTIEQIQADPSKAAAIPGGFGIDLSKIPPGTDLFSMLRNLPEQQLTQMTTGINEKFATLGDSMVNQMAVAAVKNEYTALGMDVGKLQSNYILNIGGIMLLLSLVSGAATIIVGLLASRTAAGMARDIRQGVFKKVESFSSAEFDKFSTASLITRSTNDVTQIQMRDRHYDADGFLCTNHRHWRYHPRRWKKPEYVVDSGCGRCDTAGFNTGGFFNCFAKI